MSITELRRTAVRLNSVILCNVHEFLSTQCLISRCSYDILIGYMGNSFSMFKVTHAGTQHGYSVFIGFLD